MPRTAIRPYLVEKGEDGLVRVTIRTTRFNSQGYPLVSSEVLEETFPSAARARTFLRGTYRAEPTDIATK